MIKGKTLFEKIWDQHIVHEIPDTPSILYIDLHLVHEVTSPQAFKGLREKGLPVHRPDRTFATMDHSTPTAGLELPLHDEMAFQQLRQLEQNCHEFGIKLYDMTSDKRGIVHVIGPELGLTQPGKTIVCGDSHTSTHGAFGALAFGIGTSEVEHVLATQCLLQEKPKTFLVDFSGRLPDGVSSKDMILALIAEIGTGGGTGHIIEYAGSAVRALNMEQRMTICNMSIEGGARAGMIAPDEVTFEYIAGREFAPAGAEWEKALDEWRALPTDKDASFDREIELDVSRLDPMITFGTNPGMGMSITSPVPDPADEKDSRKKDALEKALSYMDIHPGTPLLNHPVDVVFIGSCTNSRISDLREAASLLEGKRIREGVRMLVVPGSENVRRQAEAEGLDRNFQKGGWRMALFRLQHVYCDERRSPRARTVCGQHEQPQF